MIDEYVDIQYIVVIVLVGNIMTSSFKSTIFLKSKKWFIFIFSLVVASAFMYIDWRYNELNSETIKKYVISYCIATSFYDMIFKYVIQKVKGAYDGSVHRGIQ